MCLAVPGRIKRIEGEEVIVDYEVEERTAKMVSDDFKEGDYVIVQGGIVVVRVDEDEAKAALKSYKESFT